MEYSIITKESKHIVRQVSLIEELGSYTFFFGEEGKIILALLTCDVKYIAIGGQK